MDEDDDAAATSASGLSVDVHIKPEPEEGSSNVEANTFCVTCDEDLLTPESFDLHVKVKHKGYKPFPCDHCSQAFNTRISLSSHLRTHGLHGCDSCGLSFKTRMQLMAHVVKSGHADGRKRRLLTVRRTGLP